MIAYLESSSFPQHLEGNPNSLSTLHLDFQSLCDLALLASPTSSLCTHTLFLFRFPLLIHQWLCPSRPSPLCLKCSGFHDSGNHDWIFFLFQCASHGRNVTSLDSPSIFMHTKLVHLTCLSSWHCVPCSEIILCVLKSIFLFPVFLQTTSHPELVPLHIPITQNGA